MAEPIELGDLRRKTKLVDLGNGQKIAIQGLTTREICDHLETYEILRKISVGHGFTDKQLIAWATPALSAWCATALGYHRNKDAEEHIASVMTIEQAADIAEHSLFLTFSRGFGPFLHRLTALLEYLTEERGPVPDLRSAPPSGPPLTPSPPTPGPGTAPPDSSPPPSSTSNGSGTWTPPPGFTPLG